MGSGSFPAGSRSARLASGGTGPPLSSTRSPRGTNSPVLRLGPPRTPGLSPRIRREARAPESIAESDSFAWPPEPLPEHEGAHRVSTSGAARRGWSSPQLQALKPAPAPTYVPSALPDGTALAEPRVPPACRLHARVRRRIERKAILGTSGSECLFLSLRGLQLGADGLHLLSIRTVETRRRSTRHPTQQHELRAMVDQVMEQLAPKHVTNR